MLSRYCACSLLVALSGLFAGCHRADKALPVQRETETSLPAISFRDVTEKAGIDFKHFHGGCGDHNYVEVMGPGCAFLDYDQDGLLDILLLQGAPLPSYDGPKPLHPALYRNLGDGKFGQVTEQLGLALELYSLGVACGDYDNDGWPDLFITTLNGNRLFHNEGGKKFVDVTQASGIQGKDMSTSAAWIDYDRDGFLDLFVCRYMEYDLETNPRCKDTLGRPAYCTPHIYEPTVSQLLRNNGDRTFSDVSQTTGITAEKARAMGIACADFNADGLIDIFVSSDLSPNLLFLNQGNGQFKESGLLAGVGFSEMGVARAGMGVACGDYDNDGLLDLLITNFEKEPNSLFQNTGGGLFRETSVASGVAKYSTPFLGWGCQFVDLDRDERLDLFVVNGHVDDYADEKKDSMGYSQTAQVLQNTGKGTFTDVSALSGDFFKKRQVGRGAAFGDYDNDGDIDVLINCNNQKAILLRNDTPGQNNWVRIALEGNGCNRDALGAKVKLTTRTATQTKFCASGMSYLSDSDRRLLFGLGKNTNASVEIMWPCGSTQNLDIHAGDEVHVKEKNCNKREIESSVRHSVGTQFNFHK